MLVWETAPPVEAHESELQALHLSKHEPHVLPPIRPKLLPNTMPASERLRSHVQKRARSGHPTPNYPPARSASAVPASGTICSDASANLRNQPPFFLPSCAPEIRVAFL